VSVPYSSTCIYKSSFVFCGHRHIVQQFKRFLLNALASGWFQ
jgi:hypothetical protein